MKCHNCEYEHGYDIDVGDIIGEYGDFIKLYNIMEENYLDIKQEIDVYACPKCGVVSLQRYG